MTGLDLAQVRGGVGGWVEIRAGRGLQGKGGRLVTGVELGQVRGGGVGGAEKVPVGGCRGGGA